MKNITFILSLLIFVMSVMPCSDNYTCEDTDTALSAKHDHSDDEGDLCSPFCFCSCCGIKVNIQMESNSLKPLMEMADAYLFTYESLYTSSYIEKIWHPPAVC